MKPAKFHRSAPHLPVKNLRETLDYYRDVLGFCEEWTFGDRDGGIQRDDMRILFVEDPVHISAINTLTRRLNLVWYVDNIDEIFSALKQRALRSKAH
jgi:catechol 2,3-dioxygenase-like lactoylglutathione lyase family enzyme